MPGGVVFGSRKILFDVPRTDKPSTIKNVQFSRSCIGSTGFTICEGDRGSGNKNQRRVDFEGRASGGRFNWRCDRTRIDDGI